MPDSQDRCSKVIGRVFIYYGACDESTCLLDSTGDELLETLDAI